MPANPTSLSHGPKLGLADPTRGTNHVAQFYDDSAFLVKTLCRFVSDGLWASEGILIVATSDHIRDLRTALTKNDIPFHRQELEGQLVFIDAAFIARDLLIDGLPDRERFTQLIARPVESLASRFRRVRAFGEIVDILWRERNRAATLLLERMWGRLLEVHPLTLVCGYCMKGFEQVEHVEGFAEVCRAHSRVVPAEDFSELSEVEQLRLVATLQQQARTLTNEVKDRLHTERTLKHSEERLRLAFQTAGMGSWTLDVATEVVEFSIEQGRLFGLGPHELRGQLSDFVQLIVPEDRERMMTTLRKAIAGEDVRYENHYRIKRRDGEVRSLNARGRIERDVHNRAVTMFGVVIDVTAQMEAEVALRRAKVDAEAANSSKSAFLANMSHEIRTPLGAILGFSELIQDESLSADQLRSFISVIMRNGRELAALVDDILDLSKVEAGHVEIEQRTIALPVFLADISTSLGVKAREKGIRLTFETSPSVPETIVSDPTRLRQILINVIGNAVKFTSTGGVVVAVGCGQAVADGRPTIEFIVSDTGCGISDEGRQRMFKPFSQADNSMTRRFGGTGLGLVLSRKLANKLGGDVRLIDSVVGQGSVFSVTVVCGIAPTSDEDAKAKSLLRRVPVAERPLDGVRILLAEDVPDNQLLILHVLKNSGATIEVVDNGAAAVESAGTHDYDIVLMDIQMPVMDGLDATKCLRGKGFTKPIIALTAHALLEERDRCLKAGCDDHLTKPFSYKDLVLMVSKHTLKTKGH